MNNQPARDAVPYIIAGVIALGLFTVLALSVKDDNVLTRLDAKLADDLHEHAESHSALKSCFNAFTLLGSGAALVVVSALVGLVLYFRRFYWLLAAWLVTVGGGALLNEGIKEIVKRPRQSFAGEKQGWSFPSGHSLRLFVLAGLLAYLLLGLLPRRWQRLALVTGTVFLVLLCGFSRMYLGMHYLSDVVGSFTLGAGWLAAGIMTIEVMGWRKPCGS